MGRKTWKAAAGAVALLGVALALPAESQTTSAVGASAEAYGVYVNAALVEGNVPLDVPPVAWSSQDYPPEVAEPDTAEVASSGPVPADGTVVGNLGLIESSAEATATPMATAFAQVADVALLGSGGDEPEYVISADLVRAQVASDCTADPNATGTTFTNLVVEGQQIDETPDPNTEIDLGLVKIILNEQRPAFDGRGMVVNAIHIVSTTAGAAIFTGDVIIGHAMSTVSCANSTPGTTGAESPVKIVKEVTPTSTTAGQNVTYTATFTNDAESACLVNEAIDHLPVGFEPVSTSGDLGDTFTQRDRPGGGKDVIVGGAGDVTIPAGESIDQTFVVKVGDSVAPGTYFNNVELFCGNLGNFIKGLDAPVEITAVVVPTTTSTTLAGELPETGGGALPLGWVAGLGGVGAVAALVRRRLTQPFWRT